VRNGTPELRVFHVDEKRRPKVAEIRETHTVKERGGSGATPWLAFIVGALLVAVLAILLLNGRGHFSGPAGTVDLNIKSPVTTTAPANPATR
jgi:hypothetical protein